MRLNSLLQYLRKYNEMQDKIMLVYRSKPQAYWDHRHIYLSPKYSAKTPYNHRTMLDNEVVIEFDDDDLEKNRKNADEVTKRLVKHGFEYAKWFSGGKSTHVHIFIDPKNATNLPLLKSCLMRYYCQGLATPDLRLTSMNHLIRAEYGLHEKTGKHKTLISKSKEYPKLSTVPEGVWKFYGKEKERILKAKVTNTTKDLTQHEAIKFLMNTTNMREQVKDGRVRVMFLLTAVLKEKMPPKEMEDFICEWYRYSGGVKLSETQLRENTKYILERGYNVSEQTILNYCEELGIDTSKFINRQDGGTDL